MKNLVITLMTVLAISSCKPEVVIIDNPCESCEDAFILDSGIPALDGCGWLVIALVDSTLYKPVNLLEEFKINRLEVLIKYDILDSTNCGMGFADKISINEIYKKP